MLEGRGIAGPSDLPESNHPNSIDGCTDGDRGKYQKQGSVDRIRIGAVDGKHFREGSIIFIEAYVYARKNLPYTVDFYHASDATDPKWTFVGEKSAVTTNGFKKLTVVHAIQGGVLQAVRVNLRDGDRKEGSTCTLGNRNDVDDLVFAVSE